MKKFYAVSALILTLSFFPLQSYWFGTCETQGIYEAWPNGQYAGTYRTKRQCVHACLFGPTIFRIDKPRRRDR